MASAPLSVVCGEQAPICSICKDLFSNPKILSCGHSFCNACLLQHWEDSEAEPPCPRCGELFQESDIKPNKRLANLVHELTQRQEEEKAKDAEQEWRKGDIAERKEGKGVENCGRGLPNSPQDLGSVSGDILDMGLEDSSSCIAPTCKLLGVEDEGKCPICKEYMKVPTSVDCGHLFCERCITKYCKTQGALKSVKCPVCMFCFKKENFREIWQMGTLVEKLQTLGEGHLCMKHLDKPCLFCLNKEFLCNSCKKLLHERTVKEYTEKVQEVQALVLAFQETRQELMDWKVAEEKRSKECLDRLAAEEQKIRGIFEEMQNILLNKEQWLSQLEGLKRLIEKKEEENATRFPKEIYCLDDSIVKLNNIYEMPASEFLEGIRMNLSKYQKRCQPQLLELSPEVNERLRSFSEENSLLKEAIRKFKGQLEPSMNRESLVRTLWKVNVTLDQDTAQPHLAVSEDLKSVCWKAKPQTSLDNPERFDKKMCVLGCEKFTSEKYWWEVEVNEEIRSATWAVGVAKESVSRKSKFKMGPNQGIWAIGKTSEQSTSHFCAFTSPEHTYLTLRSELKKIRVYLDCRKGCVNFYDADTDGLVFAFPSASFSRETIRPFFFVWRGVQLKC